MRELARHVGALFHAAAVPPVALRDAAQREVALDVDAAGVAGSTAGTQIANDFGNLQYDGPCPPPAFKPVSHTYVITVYALDAELPLAEGLNKADLLKAMEGHIIGQGSLVSIYERVK